MVARKTLCLRRLGGNRAGELRAGRLFANPKVTAARILQSWSARTGAAAPGRHVLAIQDTSEVVFPTHPHRRRDLGPVGKGNAYGVRVHAMIAVDAASGACLGLVGGEVRNRPGKIDTTTYHRPLEQRESMRWQATAEQAKQVLTSAARVTVVADRKADTYMQWACLPEARFDLLMRANMDRRLASGGMLFQAAAGFPLADAKPLEIAPAQPGQSAQSVELALRFGEVAIARPRDPHRQHLPGAVTLRLIEVRETNPPPGRGPLHWRLLTTHTIADAAAAWQIVA